MKFLSSGVTPASQFYLPQPGNTNLVDTPVSTVEIITCQLICGTVRRI